MLTAAGLAVGALLAIGGLEGIVLVQAAGNAETRRALERERETSDALARSLAREERTSYLQRIALAERELAAGHVGRAGGLLDDCPADLRGWEWHYLKRRPYGPLTVRAPAGWAGGVAFSPDGRLVAVGGASAIN